MSENEHILEDPKQIRSFMLAGKARFSLRSIKTGKHFTYRISKTKHENKWYVLVARGNVNKPNFFLGHIRLGSADGLPYFYKNQNHLPVEVFTHLLPFEWFIHHLGDTQLEFYHEGKCGKCGRALTDPESINRGIGPECAKQFAMSEDF